MSGMKLWAFYLPFPQEIVDQGLELSLGEYRLLGYLIRHQIRLGRAVIKLTQDDLFNGRRLADGKRADRGCAIKNFRDLKEARTRLVDRGWIRYEETAEGFVYEIVTQEQPALSTPSTASTGQEQNVPKVQEQNVPESGTKCTQSQVQNVPAYKEVKGSNKVSIKEPCDEIDPRHNLTRKLFILLFATSNGISEDKVPWNGGDGKALQTFLREHSKWEIKWTGDPDEKLSRENGEIVRCLFAWFRSDVNIAQRGRYVFKVLDQYLREVNEFGRPREFTKEYARRAQGY